MTCPDREQLSQLLQERLPPAQQTEIQAHLETCALCQQALDRLAAGGPTWERAAQLGAAGEPAIEQVVRSLESDPPGEATPRGAETQGEAGAACPDDLSFLAPPAQAGHLGRLGHYEVLEVVGRGGMGVVLKAIDERLQRVVAVKVLGPQYAGSGSARKRFQREAKAAAAVSHDHVVPIYHVDDVGGVSFLVMPLIGGRSLQERVDQDGALGLAEVLRIGMQTAQGLAAAHAQGLVHRDIKPANILLENGVERVKITDFGLARAVDDASVTQSGVISGTPMFMSPEQARGEQNVDHRSDLFSLGSVMYMMATGRPPFRASGSHATLKRVIEDTPRPLREINPDLPDWLETIVSRLHAKDPKDRFASAREVADLLGQHLAHLQEPRRFARPPEVPRDARPARPRGRARFWVALLAFVIVAPFAVYYLLSESHTVRVEVPPGVRGDVRPEPPGPATIPGWGKVVDPRGDCSVRFTNDRLTIQVPGGKPHNLTPLPMYNLDAPRVLQDVDGNFRVQVRVLPFAPPLPDAAGRPGGISFTAAGLVVWQDDKNFLRFERMCIGEGEGGRPQLYAELFKDGQKVGGAQDWLPEGVTYFQIERRGDRFDLRYSKDGKAWPSAAEGVTLALAQRLRVGVQAANSTTRDIAPEFQGLTVENPHLDPDVAVLLAPGGGGPFVTTRTLLEALEVAQLGSIIELRGNGPFVTPALKVQQELTIRAGKGFEPTAGGCSRSGTIATRTSSRRCRLEQQLIGARRNSACE
jgi:serine/threonine protein kinase